MNVLIMNPGGNSLKVELVACSAAQEFAFEGRKLVSVTVEGIEKKIHAYPSLKGKKLPTAKRSRPRTMAQQEQIFSPGWKKRNTSTVQILIALV